MKKLVRRNRRSGIGKRGNCTKEGVRKQESVDQKETDVDEGII